MSAGRWKIVYAQFVTTFNLSEHFRTNGTLKVGADTANQAKRVRHNTTLPLRQFKALGLHNKSNKVTIVYRIVLYKDGLYTLVIKKLKTLEYNIILMCRSSVLNTDIYLKNDSSSRVIFKMFLSSSTKVEFRMETRWH